MKHIVIACSRLDLPGGIERAVVSTANLLKTSYQVTLLILDQSRDSFYSIDPGITIVQKDLKFGIGLPGSSISRKWRLVQDIRSLRKVVKELRADVIISSETVFSSAFILSGSRRFSKVVSWEHHHFYWLQQNRFWRFIRDYSYPKLDRIICLNEKEGLLYERLGLTTIIPNHVSVKNGLCLTRKNELLSIGWLIPRKGIDLMMEAAALVLKRYPGWTWRLVGKGEMENFVLDFIQKNEIQDQFILEAPKSEHLEERYGSSSLFVLTSRFEAFPMVLLEALSYGVPCVSFDCESGPSDIIIQGEDGLLVPKEDVATLAKSISELIYDEERRKKMGEKAIQNSMRFSPETILREWKDLLDNL